MFSANASLKYVFVISILVIFPSSAIAFADHLFEQKITFSQYLDIAQLMAEKYSIEVDGKTFVIYYGYGGSLEVDVEKPQNHPQVSQMAINKERKSLEISFADAAPQNIMWLRLPVELISAKETKYQLFIDGKETMYDLSKYQADYAIGFLLPEGSRHVEITGTRVIPEFNAAAVLILGASFGSTLYFMRKEFNFAHNLN